MEKREIKFNFIYGIDGQTETYFNRTFTFAEIENAYHTDVLCDSPLYKEYSILGKRQFTGLKDSKGVEIFEGDIVKYTLTHDPSEKDIASTVTWHRHAWRLNNLWLLTEINSIEVIGNIFENPNLK